MITWSTWERWILEPLMVFPWFSQHFWIPISHFRIAVSASQQHIHDSRQCRDASCVHLVGIRRPKSPIRKVYIWQGLKHTEMKFLFEIPAIDTRWFKIFTQMFRVWVSIDMLWIQIIQASDNGQPERWIHKFLPIHRFRLKVLRPDAVENRMLRHLHLSEIKQKPHASK